MLQIRCNTFETNSSSNHSLIITNSKEFNEENEKITNEIKKWTSGIVYPKILDTKEDKVYMLGGFFDWVHKEGYSSYDDEYEVFIQVLKDSNEEELIKNLETNGKDYLSGEDDEPYCTNYFWEGTLMGCYCGFDRCFDTYFKNYPDKDGYFGKYGGVYIDDKLIEIFKPNGPLGVITIDAGYMNLEEGTHTVKVIMSGTPNSAFAGTICSIGGITLDTGESMGEGLVKVTEEYNEGDLLGAVLLAGQEPLSVPGDAEYKLAQTIAAFLGKQMES